MLIVRRKKLYRLHFKFAALTLSANMQPIQKLIKTTVDAKLYISQSLNWIPAKFVKGT